GPVWLGDKDNAFLASLELGSLMPPAIGAAGKAHDNLLAPLGALVGLVDVDHGLVPYRGVLADSLGGAAGGHRLRPRLGLGGRNAHAPHSSCDDQVRLRGLGHGLARLQAADRILRMHGRGRHPRRRCLLVSDRPHGPAVAEDPARRLKNQRLALADTLTWRQFNGDVVTGVAAERLGRLDHAIDTRDDRTRGRGDRLERRGPDIFYGALEHEPGLRSQGPWARCWCHSGSLR